jgi:hypothetical protein
VPKNEALVMETKLQQLRAKWLADRIAAADPKAGAQLIRDLSRGGGEKARKGDVIARTLRKRRRKSTGE